MGTPTINIQSLHDRANALLKERDFDGLSALDSEVRVLVAGPENALPGANVSPRASSSLSSDPDSDPNADQTPRLTKQELVGLQELYVVIAREVAALRDSAAKKASGMQASKKGIKAYQSL